MSKSRYFLYRTLQTVFLVWLVLTFLFFLFRLMPGSYTDIMIYRGASPDTVAAFRETWGLNDPLHVQYWRYITNMATLEAGTSFRTRQPVWEYVQMRIFNSFILVAPAVTFVYLLGSGIGAYLGSKRDMLVEKGGLVSLIFFGTFPEFFVAIVLVIVFASWLGFFPTSGMTSVNLLAEYDAWWQQYLTKDFLLHYILPFSAIVLRFTYLPALLMRTNVVEVKDQDFIKFYRITGLPSSDRLKNLAYHASLPVITMYPITMTRALSGMVLIEMVFNWPGIGYALVQAVLSQDLPVVQFVFAVTAVFVILSNFAIDVLYGVIDPRISVDE
jgi:peptide/nickel transport system permease protein